MAAGCDLIVDDVTGVHGGQQPTAAQGLHQAAQDAAAAACGFTVYHMQPEMDSVPVGTSVSIAMCAKARVVRNALRARLGRKRRARN